MQNNNENMEKVSKTSISPQQGYKSLFSDREIRNIIKEFIDSYVAGQIKIIFPENAEMISVHKQKGEKIDENQAERETVELKVNFVHRISVCAGTEKATPEERQKAICSLFESIISFRNTQRLVGAFHDYGTEKRLSELEEGMEKVNKLIEELVEYLMKR